MLSAWQLLQTAVSLADLLMTLPPPSADRTLNIYLTLAQYPILQTKIRARMRRELFNRGVITQQDFEAEVRKGGCVST
jgi:hypothetical protein